MPVYIHIYKIIRWGCCRIEGSSLAGVKVDRYTQLTLSTNIYFSWFGDPYDEITIISERGRNFKYLSQRSKSNQRERSPIIRAERECENQHQPPPNSILRRGTTAPIRSTTPRLRFIIRRGDYSRVPYTYPHARAQPRETFLFALALRQSARAR